MLVLKGWCLFFAGFDEGKQNFVQDPLLYPVPDYAFSLYSANASRHSVASKRRRAKACVIHLNARSRVLSLSRRKGSYGTSAPICARRGAKTYKRRVFCQIFTLIGLLTSGATLRNTPFSIQLLAAEGECTVWLI